MKLMHDRKLTMQRQQNHNGAGMEVRCLGRKSHTGNTKCSVSECSFQ